MPDERDYPTRAELGPLLELVAWRKLDQLRSLGCTKLEGELAYEGETAVMRFKAVMPVPIQCVTLTLEVGDEVPGDAG